jgi:hypothetical protein
MPTTSLLDYNKLSKELGLSLSELKKMSSKNLEILVELNETRRLYLEYRRASLQTSSEDEIEKKWQALKSVEMDIMKKVRPHTNKFAKFMMNLKQVREHIESLNHCNHGFIICNFKISNTTTNLYNSILYNEDMPKLKILTIMLYWMYGRIYYLPFVWGDSPYDHLPLRDNGLVCDKGVNTFMIGDYPYITALDEPEGSKMEGSVDVLRIGNINPDQYLNIPRYPEGIPEEMIPNI